MEGEVLNDKNDFLLLPFFLPLIINLNSVWDKKTGKKAEQLVFEAMISAAQGLMMRLIFSF